MGPPVHFLIDLWPTGILFLVIIGFGFWTSRLGKPYNWLLFNIHKLIALGAVILAGIRIWRMDPLSTFPNLEIMLIALAVLGVISMFATGAIMSIQDEVKRIFQWIHRISAVVIALSLASALYLLNQ